MNLRDFLKKIRRDRPYDVLEINEEVSSILEPTSILWDLELKGKYPIVIFKAVKNLYGAKSNYPVITNIFALRERCAYILDTTVEELSKKYSELENKPLKPIVVCAKNAPVKEIVKTGNDVDLREFPIIKHHEKDAGPYITAGVCILKHPTYGYNAAILRLQYKGPRKLGVFMIPGRHSDIYFKYFKERGEDMPIAIVIGHHPRFYLGAQTIQPIDKDEYEIISGVMEEPLRLTRSETLGKDFLIPADAEIVIEGKVLVDVEEPEGPFGEYTGYYGPQVRHGRVIEVTAINMRKDAIYQDIFAGHLDHIILGTIPIEARIYRELKRISPSVINVHLPPSGGGRLICYIKVRKSIEGESKNLLMAALSIYPFIKMAVVVDEDIDIFNESKVMWAIATRTKFSEDVIIVPKCQKAGLDPMADGVSDKLGIDATLPLDRKIEPLKKPGNLD